MIVISWFSIFTFWPLNLSPCYILIHISFEFQLVMSSDISNVFLVLISQNTYKWFLKAQVFFILLHNVTNTLCSKPNKLLVNLQLYQRPPPPPLTWSVERRDQPWPHRTFPPAAPSHHSANPSSIEHHRPSLSWFSVWSCGKRKSRSTVWSLLIFLGVLVATFVILIPIKIKS